MCRSTLRLAGLRKTVLARTAWLEQVSTTTWPTRTASRKHICSCIASIARLGRSKWCYDRGSRNGNWRSQRRADLRPVSSVLGLIPAPFSAVCGELLIFDTNQQFATHTCNFGLTPANSAARAVLPVHAQSKNAHTRADFERFSERRYLCSWFIICSQDSAPVHEILERLSGEVANFRIDLSV